MDKIVDIGGKAVGSGRPAFIMADVGANHNGDLGLAKEFIRICASIGLDAVKFQSFVVDKYHAKRIKKNGVWVDNPKYLKNLPVEMPLWWHQELKALSDKLGILLLSTADDTDTVEMLDVLGLPAQKLSSQDIIFYPLIERMAKTGKPVIISTGLADLKMIECALKVCKDASNENIVLLHCVCCYPAEFVEMNLKAIETLKKYFGLPVGLSDHTVGLDLESVCSIAAVTLGACMIEKHITLDRSQEGIDHHFALEPKEFERLIKQVRTLEKALGNGIKEPCARERVRFIEVTKSIHAKINLKKGERILPENIKIVRPGEGIPPFYYKQILGSRLVFDVQEDEPIQWEMLDSPMKDG